MENSTKTGQKVVKVLPNVKILSTLRNSGYNNQNAITDIIDNSLDNEVDAKNVKIELSFGKKNPPTITIADDGSGMTEEVLIEALKLGSSSEKDPAYDLGCYGTGLKSAGLSLGKCITVITKHADGEHLKGIFDYDYMIKNDTFEILISSPDANELKEFNSLVKSKTNKLGTGTVIILSKLDRITDSNITQFKNLLVKEIGLTFKYFLDEKGVNISVNGEKVIGLDPMMRNNELSSRMNGDDHNSFEYNNKIYKFNCYHINGTTNKEEIEIQRNTRNAGIYIYRNGRLVGKALSLGMFKKADGWHNGFRAELFIDGNDDSIFGSTFLKFITEKDAMEINQGFKDKLDEATKPYRISSSNVARKSTNKTTEAVKLDMDKVFDDINSNKLIHRKVTKRIKEDGSPEDEIPDVDLIKPPVKRKYPQGTTRISKSYEWKTRNYGEAGVVNEFIYENGKIIILWNADHKFWKEYMVNASAKDKLMISKIFIAQARALEKSPDEFRNVFWDIFNSDTGVELNRVMAQ